MLHAPRFSLTRWGSVIHATRLQVPVGFPARFDSHCPIHVLSPSVSVRVLCVIVCVALRKGGAL